MFCGDSIILIRQLAQYWVECPIPFNTLKEIMMKGIFAVFTALVTSLALAHPGHDHSSWTAPLIHAIWLLPLVLAVGVVAYFIHKKFNK